MLKLSPDEDLEVLLEFLPLLSNEDLLLGLSNELSPEDERERSMLSELPRDILLTGMRERLPFDGDFLMA